jgi:hypothetical protein
MNDDWTKPANICISIIGVAFIVYMLWSYYL